MSGELGTVWIMHFDMVHSFLQNYVSLNRYGMKFCVYAYRATGRHLRGAANLLSGNPPEVNHVPYDAEILWTYIWNWMYGKTDLYETDRPECHNGCRRSSYSTENGRHGLPVWEAANTLGFIREGADDAVPALV